MALTSDADIYAQNITLNADHSTFSIWNKHTQLGQVHLTMPGPHNVLNALAACAVALDLDIPFATIAQAFSSFKGIERRFSYRGTFKGAEVFDDYGHHPNEILNTLLVARNRTKNKVTVVFQPHRYTLNDKLWDSFIKTFIESGIDHLIVTDIYAASELPIPGITSQLLVEEIQRHNPRFTISYAPDDQAFAAITQQLNPLVDQGDLVLLLGAGKINKMAEILS